MWSPRLPKIGIKAKSGLIVGAATLFGLVIGHLSVARAPAIGDTPEPAPLVFLLGQRLAGGEGAVRRALSEVRRYAARELGLELPGGKIERLKLAELGAEIDKVRLAELARAVGDPTSSFRRYWAAESPGTGQATLPVPIVLDAERTLERLLEIKQATDRPPRDARLDLERRSVTAEVIGWELDVHATLSKLERALTDGAEKTQAVVRERMPHRRAADLSKVDFDHVLGHFETRYSLLERDRARTFNLRLAASRLDGYVLLPGEIFAFNDVVGPRDEANGYKVAPVIASGELVDGIGGGTCQISGTLHGAVFFSGLEIVERYPHTRPSSYIKMGLDATVVYPTIDFRFKNNLGFPVVLHQTVRDGVVRAEILGPAHKTEVTLIRRIDGALPYEEIERPDPSLPRDMRVLAQRGVAGFKLHRYRIVRRGPHAVRERWNDVYPPTSQIVRVGSGDPSQKTKSSDDPHPEYTADELLVLTLAAEDDGDTEKRFREDREPGRFGKLGWTESAGMPQWTSSITQASEQEKRPTGQR